MWKHLHISSATTIYQCQIQPSWPFSIEKDLPKAGLLSVLLAPKEKPGVWAAGAGVLNCVAESDAPKLNPPEAGGAGVLRAGFWVAADVPPKENVGAEAGRGAAVCVEAPKTGAAEGVVVFPKEKPAPPNVGWLLVPNAGAAVLAAAPNMNAVVPLLPLPAPNAKGFGAAGVCCVDAGKVELPKLVCVVGVSEDVVVLIVMPNPPNGVDVEFWFADCWPKLNVLWACGAGAGFAAPNWKAEVVPLALTVLVFSIGVAVVVAPNWNVVFVAGAVVVVPVQLPNRDREGVWVDGRQMMWRPSLAGYWLIHQMTSHCSVKLKQRGLMLLVWLSARRH